MSALGYWIWLAEKHGLSKKSAIMLVDRLGSPEKIYFARDEEYENYELTQQEKELLKDKNMIAVRGILGRCAAEDIRIITYSDSEYPERLRNIFDPPLVLYIKGKLPILDEEPAVAVVGTRSCTVYGLKTAERIAYEYALMGGVIVSGLAKGIDSAAIRGALRAGGKVVGVMGCGLDISYPAENKSLIEDVIAVGAVISEYPPETPPIAGNFPVRNRIMSGICVGVAVVEAPEKSGALITAARALEQGRDVFAAPGNLDAPACEGANRLLREGATIITSGKDLAEEYLLLFPEKLIPENLKKAVELDEKSTKKLVENEAKAPKKPQKENKKVVDKKSAEEYIAKALSQNDLSETEKAVLKAVGGETKQIDELILLAGVAAPEVLAAVTMLEIKGILKQEIGKKFHINQELK